MSASWPTTFLQKGEEEFLATSKLSRATPYVIRGVRNSQLSIARLSGGITYNGAYFTYVPHTDELIRDDVVKALVTRRERAQRAADRMEAAKQTDLFKLKRTRAPHAKPESE